MVRPSPAAEEGNEHPGWKCCYCTDGKTLVEVPLTMEELRNGPDSTKKDYKEGIKHPKKINE